MSAGPVTHRYSEYGGGELDAFACDARRVAAGRGRHGRRATCSCCRRGRRERCASTRSSHIGVGFDLDFALRLRQAGRKVVTADLRVIRHKTLKVVEDLDVWVEGHIDLADKWDGRLPGAPPRPADWKERARLAEAERDAARAHAYSQLLAARRPRRAARATARGDDRHVRLAADRAAARVERAPPRRRYSPRARRTSSRETSDWLGATPARIRSFDSRSATANAFDSSIRRSRAS